MPHHGHGHEEVHLTAYERRQFEMIEQALVREDPGRPRVGHGRKEWSTANVLLWALVTLAGWAVLIGVFLSAALLAVLGAAGAAGAVLLYRRKRRKVNDVEPDGATE